MVKGKDFIREEVMSTFRKPDCFYNVHQYEMKRNDSKDNVSTVVDYNGEIDDKVGSHFIQLAAKNETVVDLLLLIPLTLMILYILLIENGTLTRPVER